jgi:hypothetical protein
MAQDNGIVFDRNRITHGESKQVAVLSMRLQQAQRDMDADKVETCMNAIDRIIGKIVVAVPPEWLPKGVSVGDDGWLDALAQEHYEEVVAAAQPGESARKAV